MVADFATNGAMNNPNQPAFVAKLSVEQLNTTGTGTYYKIIFDTVLSDNYSQYNATTGEWIPTFPGVYVVSYGFNYLGALATTLDGTMTLFRNFDQILYKQFPPYSSALSSGGSASQIDSRILVVSGTTDAYTVQVTMTGNMTDDISIYGDLTDYQYTYFSAVKIA